LKEKKKKTEPFEIPLAPKRKKQEETRTSQTFHDAKEVRIQNCRTQEPQKGKPTK